MPGDYPFVAGDNGVHTFTNGVTFRTAGTRTVTATDGSITGTSPGVVVGYAAATYFPITPARVLDTRPTGYGVIHMGILPGPFVAGTVHTFNVANAPYVGGGTAVAVPANAVAVTGNLTVVWEERGRPHRPGSDDDLDRRRDDHQLRPAAKFGPTTSPWASDPAEPFRASSGRPLPRQCM